MSFNLDKYLQKVRSKGRYSITLSELQENSNLSDKAIQQTIFRAKKKLGSTEVSGTYDTKVILEVYFPKIAACFESMPIIVPDQIIAEDDSVLRLGHGEGGIAKNGMEYNNIYCFVIQEKDGKIKEFCDTDLVQKTEL